MRLPKHADFRGGGLLVRFVSNPLKQGGRYDIAAHVEAMRVLYGACSVERETVKYGVSNMRGVLYGAWHA